MLFLFFFQAEDGIRDLVRSRGLGDVYKRQANAYLDHYYIIMGRTEDYSLQLPEEFPFLNRIPLTEECKILPATGVYAVSVVSGNETLKGMAIINQTPGKPDEVLLNVFENEEKIKREAVTLFFHKMIRGSVDFSDKKAPVQLGRARAEIEDLIY